MQVVLDLEDSAVHAHQLYQHHLLVVETIKLFIEHPVECHHQILDLLVIQSVLRESVLALERIAASEQLTGQLGQVHEDGCKNDQRASEYRNQHEYRALELGLVPLITEAPIQ